MEKRRFRAKVLAPLSPREACRSLGRIFDGILGIKSRIKVMPTLKFVVPEPCHGWTTSHPTVFSSPRILRWSPRRWATGLKVSTWTRYASYASLIYNGGRGTIHFMGFIPTSNVNNDPRVGNDELVCSKVWEKLHLYDEMVISIFFLCYQIIGLILI